jgi:hypothetical protein
VLVILVGEERPGRNDDARVLVGDAARALMLALNDARSVRNANRDRSGLAEARCPIVDIDFDRLQHGQSHGKDQAEDHPRDPTRSDPRTKHGCEDLAARARSALHPPERHLGVHRAKQGTARPGSHTADDDTNAKAQGTEGSSLANGAERRGDSHREFGSWGSIANP